MGPGAPPLRPVDLARPYGLSSQAIRNYERQGILPAATRTAAGHRRYDERHRLALRAFHALVPAYGHATSAEILRLAGRGAVDELLALLDEGHAQLARDRATLALVGRAVGELTGPHPIGAAPDPGPIPIGVLAHRLGLRPATLRTWEAAGILRPARERATGYRSYRADDVRDAQLAHQLRRAGHPLGEIAEVLTELREHGSRDQLRRALDDRRAAVRRRGLAMLRAAGALSALLDEPATR